jgi:hypothetical protein
VDTGAVVNLLSGDSQGGDMKAKASKPVTGVLTFVAAAIILLLLGMLIGALSAIFG